MISLIAVTSAWKTKQKSGRLRGGGVQAYHFGKKHFEIGVGREVQDTSRHFDGSFGSIRAILPM